MTSAPFLTALRPMIGDRHNPKSALTKTSGEPVFLEVRRPIEIKVPIVVMLSSGPSVRMVPWMVQSGEVLMVYWHYPGEDERKVLGLRGYRYLKVRKFRDIMAASRAYTRHIPNSMLEKDEKELGTRVKVAGEFRRLEELTQQLVSADIDSPAFGQLLREARDLSRRIRQQTKVQASEALAQGKLPQAIASFQLRQAEILDQLDRVRKIAGEIRRIKNRMRNGFRLAYKAMAGYAEGLEDGNLQREVVARQIEGLLQHLTWSVAAFKPFYDYARSEELGALARVPAHLRAGRIRTAINLIREAMRSIEKAFRGEEPSYQEIRRLVRRIASAKRRLAK